MAQINIELAGKIIKLFRSVVSNYKIYPPGSQIVINNLNSLHAEIVQYLQTQDTLTINESHHKMLIDDQEIKALTDTFILALLAELEIQSITFRKGINPAELSVFMDLITSKDKTKFKETGGGVSDVLKSKNVNSIAVDAVKYVAIKEGEEVVNKISALVDNLQGDPMAFMASLREIYDSMDAVPDIKTKKGITDTLAKKLATLDPANLKEFFDRPLPGKIEQSGLKEAVLSSLPKEKIREIFDEIALWYEDIKRTSKTEFEALEQLSGLKSFLGKILSSPSARNIPFRFYEELLHVGVLDELPVWIKKEEPTLVLQVDKILEKDSLSLLDPEIRGSLPRMVKQLCQSELSEVAEKITNKMAENLKQPSMKVRSETIRTLMQIYDVLVIFQKEKILKNMEQTFLAVFQKEKNIEIYQDLVSLLAKRVFQHILNNQIEEAISILKLIKQHLYSETEGDKERRDVTGRNFVKLAGDLSGLIIAELKSGVDKRQKNAMEIVSLMEDTMGDTLMAVIKESDDYRTRKIAAIALRNIGEMAVKNFIKSLNLTTNTETLKKIINIFDEFTTINITDKLKELLDYPDPIVKKMILRHLYKMNTPETRGLLLERLSDKDLMADVVKIVGELKQTEALDRLLSISNVENVTLQEELAITFGMLGDKKALPTLIKFLKGRKSFFKSNNLTPDSVRMRAAWALSKFLPDKTAENALTEALKDKSDSVKLEAKKALEKNA
ncbi:MAG: hypothetical protein ABIA17_05705 [Elusimicrobiota bacterium]